MLQLKPVKNFSEKQSHLESIDPFETSWIVSDLKSKSELQKRIMKQTNFVEDINVLRASELWKTIYLRFNPQARLISQDLTATILSHWLKPMELQWTKSAESQKTLLIYLEQLLPLLVQKNGEELLLEWMEEHPESQIRWRSWFELSKRAWDYLRAQGLTPLNMVSGALIEYDVEELNWSKHLVFDLGSEISPLEVDLIHRMSKSNSVTVIVPTTSWTHRFSASSACYERLKN